MRSTFSELGLIFKKKSVTPVLVGGYAAASYGIQRMTFDIDFMITLPDYETVESDLLDMGYSVFNRSDAFVQLKAKPVELRDIDFLISDIKTITAIKQYGRQSEIAGVKFIVPSAMHLIAMKIHAIVCDNGRELKDSLDIVQMIKLEGIDPKKQEIKALFDRYNALELYEKIVKAAK
jgi:hypothetical protein